MLVAPWLEKKDSGSYNVLGTMLEAWDTMNKIDECFCPHGVYILAGDNKQKICEVLDCSKNHEAGQTLCTAVKTPLEKPWFHVRMLGPPSPSASDSSFLLRHALRGSSDGSHARVPATHMGVPD